MSEEGMKQTTTIGQTCGKVIIQLESCSGCALGLPVTLSQLKKTITDCLSKIIQKNAVQR